MTQKTYINRAVREAQTYLRDWGRRNGSRFQLIPDGVYGRETRFTVQEFQHGKGLPETGVIDLQTWDALAADYQISRRAALKETIPEYPEPAGKLLQNEDEAEDQERRFMWPGDQKR